MIQAYEDNGLLDVGDVQHDMEYTTPETGSRTSIVITPVLPEYVTPAGSRASLVATPGLMLPSPGDEKFVSATSLIIGPDFITIPVESQISRESSRVSADQDPIAILASTSSLTSSESGERVSGITLVTVTPRSSRSGSRSSSRSRSKPIPSSSSESEDYRTPPMSGSVVFHAPLQVADTDGKEESETDVSPRSTTEGAASGASSPSPPQDYDYAQKGKEKGAFSFNICDASHRDSPETYGFRSSAPESLVRDNTAEIDWYAGETTPVSDLEGWYVDNDGRLGEQSGVTVNFPSFYEHPERDIRHSRSIQEIARRLTHLESIISGLRTLQTPPERDCYFSEREELLARIERLEGVLATLPVHVDTPERDWYTSVDEEILTRLSRLEDVISVLPSHVLVEPQWYPRSDFDDFMAGRLEEPNHFYLGDFSGHRQIDDGDEPERQTPEYDSYPLDDETPERDWEEEGGRFVRLPTDDDVGYENAACSITIKHL
ncbi:uncharacterized protein LOC135499982 [Lineus longissimus]|uniref:uncharacterized protein LOC135499982 n=1 Tax=Lineus longissimus TaxID=88925 RepID=UPI002B4DC880